MIAIPLIILFLLGAPQQPGLSTGPTAQQALEQAKARYEAYRQAAIHINELAGNIHSEADARAFVDAVAERLGGEELPSWATASIRCRRCRTFMRWAVTEKLPMVAGQSKRFGSFTTCSVPIQVCRAPASGFKRVFCSLIWSSRGRRTGLPDRSQWGLIQGLPPWRRNPSWPPRSVTCRLTGRPTIGGFSKGFTKSCFRRSKKP